MAQLHARRAGIRGEAVAAEGRAALERSRRTQMRVVKCKNPDDGRKKPARPGLAASTASQATE